MLWQSTNQALRLLAPPQVSYELTLVDLQRLAGNSLWATDRFELGQTVLVTDVELGIQNVELRIVEIEYNHLIPGDTRIILQSRARRLSELLFKQQHRTTTTVSQQIRQLQQTDRNRTGGGGA